MNSTVERCLAIAAATGAFSPAEITVLGEVLAEWALRPGRDYFLLTGERDGVTAGFIIFGPAPMTEFAFDLYWIAVDPAFQKKGTGRLLEAKMCSALLEKSHRAVIRTETSGREDYRGQRLFYLAAGYGECGRIQDFYREGDDLVLYCKKIGEQ
ncbi:MAG: GNAT family N-acetyltransferase [Aminivibrio sp.]|nr:GNAT family N-acetyltransferase [Synergistaceae bacterium]